MSSESEETTFDPFPRPGEPDFNSFPKQIPEDSISYSIHVVSPHLKTEAEVRSRLKEIQSSSNKLAKSMLIDYIWQRESFSISVTSSTSSSAPAPGQPTSKLQRTYLQGKTEFGDSIADEWVIVYLLRELSQEFKDAWIRVEDADGEFLLVEAANALPSWLNPEIAPYRVWIHNGKLNIIPQDIGSFNSIPSKTSRSHVANSITLSQALEFIARSPSRLIQSSAIESEAFYRLKNYPRQISETFHTASIIVPRKLAYILHRTPLHISPATEAFYLRDPISMRPLHIHEDNVNLRFPPVDFVTISVRFTRVGYAQLKSQEFNQPPTWRNASSFQTIDVDEKERANMGMKVACGFEMLMADPQNKDKRAVREIDLLLEDLGSGEELLPSDDEMKNWKRIDDNENWLDVNFEDFEKELAGHQAKDGVNGNGTGEFGDKTAQENLRRIVENFERFLNDDDAGFEGAEWEDDMDYDDDDEEDEDEEEDKAGQDSLSRSREGNIPKEHEDFGEIMAKIMQLSMKEKEHLPSTARKKITKEFDSSEEIEEDMDIKQLSDAMEAELRASGALDLEPKSAKKITKASEAENDSEDGNQPDPRYIMAKNILESFKGQTGAPGPAGSMMSSMGLSMPRDDSRK